MPQLTISFFIILTTCIWLIWKRLVLLKPLEQIVVLFAVAVLFFAPLLSNAVFWGAEFIFVGIILVAVYCSFLNYFFKQPGEIILANYEVVGIIFLLVLGVSTFFSVNKKTM